MKKMFNFNSDLMDIDFFLFPTDDPEAEFDPEKIKKNGVKISYHYERDMDKPEVKIEGDIDNEKLQEYFKMMNINDFKNVKKFKNFKFEPKKPELDAESLTLEPSSHTHGLKVLEPYTEVNDFDDFTEIILEVPGIENEEEIYFDFDNHGKRLAITAHSPARRYHKVIDLPFPSSKEDISLKLNNGIADLKVVRQI